MILLADHSKFGREALVRVAPITAVHRIVTTPGVDPAEAAAIRDLGIDLIIAEPARTTRAERIRRRPRATQLRSPPAASR